MIIWWRLILMTTILILSQRGWSATLNMTLKGDELVFRNAQQHRLPDTYVLTDWQVVSGLAPTTRWQPGMVTTSANKLTLSGPGGVVDLPIKLRGIEYNIAGTNDFTSEGEALIGSGACGSDVFKNGSIISFYADTDSMGMDLLGPYSDCYAWRGYYLSKNIQPFYFVRPIFSINKQDLLQVLENLDDPIGGMYTGSIPISLKYLYQENGITTYRNVPLSSFSVQLNYTSETLTDIQADTLKIIEPVYDKATHTASGETIFNIRANGYFQSGIRMTFLDRDYKMKLEDGSDDGLSTIPYYIRCNACAVNSIVENGQLTADARNPVEYRVGNAVSSFEFNLTVGYENISAEDVELSLGSLTYTDTFTIIFEEIL